MKPVPSAKGPSNLNVSPGGFDDIRAHSLQPFMRIRGVRHEATQDRMEEHGVKIVKRLGEAGASADGDIANAMNMGPTSTDDPSELDALIEGLQSTGFESILFAEDPDGNLLEVIKKDGL